MRETVREEMRSVKSSDALGWLWVSKRSLEQLGKNLQLCFESKHGFLLWGLGRLQQGKKIECDV